MENPELLMEHGHKKDLMNLMGNPMGNLYEFDITQWKNLMNFYEFDIT